MPEFKKILIANRGEIAIRVMRAANEMGKKTVAVYAEEDKLCLHRFKADEAYRIGEGLSPVGAYLSIPEIIRVAQACRGPMRSIPAMACCRKTPISSMPAIRRASPSSARRAETMRALGDKASARRVAMAAGVPVIPATEVLGDDMDADQEAGGGGRLSPDAQGVLGRRRARHAPDPGRGRAGGQGARRPARGRGRLWQRRGLSGKDDPARPPCRGADPGRQARRASITCRNATAPCSAATRRSSNAPPPPI